MMAIVICCKCCRIVNKPELRVALGRAWHVFCFACYVCRKVIDECSAVLYNEELYCKTCHALLFEDKDPQSALTSGPVNSDNLSNDVPTGTTYSPSLDTYGRAKQQYDTYNISDKTSGATSSGSPDRNQNFDKRRRGSDSVNHSVSDYMLGQHTTAQPTVCVKCFSDLCRCGNMFIRSSINDDISCDASRRPAPRNRLYYDDSCELRRRCSRSCSPHSHETHHHMAAHSLDEPSCSYIHSPPRSYCTPVNSDCSGQHSKQHMHHHHNTNNYTCSCGCDPNHYECEFMPCEHSHDHLCDRSHSSYSTYSTTSDQQTSYEKLDPLPSYVPSGKVQKSTQDCKCSRPVAVSPRPSACPSTPCPPGTCPLILGFGGGGSKCHRCQKLVYPREQQLAAGSFYHYCCFTCFCCREPLEPRNFSEGHGEVYCRHCWSGICEIKRHRLRAGGNVDYDLPLLCPDHGGVVDHRHEIHSKIGSLRHLSPKKTHGSPVTGGSSFDRASSSEFSRICQQTPSSNKPSHSGRSNSSYCAHK
ncbi:uncharacterized protein LOC113376634 isoform X2 [Ctenocephalides felis]|uniref:uncharacterized protein LOC113376634 isoform X2 n=1 Tax=Ctenocephalides felis TaxID=7515 RepID=UPI000E6E3B30|nr:uncharacterized protein LOC113376634 isoform X2 [Ctenocephalides felis]